MKKLISLITALLILSTPVFAWQGDADYAKRIEYVNSNELDLYVEGAREKAPYYGARLEPTSGIYFGTIAERSDFLDNFSTCLTYMEFSSMQPDLYYPANEMVRNNNLNVMLGWNVESAESIKNIDSYTDYIEQTAQTLSSYGRNMYVRFGAEMNTLELGSGEEFKYAFRKVSDIVRKYDNLAMVWSPIDMGSIDKPFIDYYPGDEYVDWIGVNSYQIKYLLSNQNASEVNKILFMTDNYAWHTNSLKPILSFMEEYGIQKPVMISEGGVANGNTFGEDTSDWAAPRVRNMYWNIAMKYPQIKMINYFNTQMDWETEFFNIDNHQDLIDIVQGATDSGAFITRNGENKFTFTKTQNSGILIGPRIPVYAHAYAKNADNIGIDYYMDGMPYQYTTQSPHKAVIDLTELYDGTHTLDAYSYNGDVQLNSKSVSFNKIGAFINFSGDIVTNKQITVSLNDKQIDFDVDPCVISDTTLVPIRAFANTFGISDNNIDYNGSENTVTIQNGRKSIKLFINNPKATINGNDAQIDVPPTVIGERTLVPLRFISENFGCSVDYNDSDTQLNIFLTSK